MGYNDEQLLKLKKEWKKEEQNFFAGWDFSHLKGRWDDERIPWDYETILKSYLKTEYKILDIGTGGGEFITSIGHPLHNIAVTEKYPPNVKICMERLAPQGVDVKQIYDDNKMPFEDNEFDMVVDRHEDFDINEVRRVLKPNGIFVTQQVGGENDRDLVVKLLGNIKQLYKANNLENNIKTFESAGFKVLKSDESFTPLKFFDVGALVYFAKIIEWEFLGFSVGKCFDKLVKCQQEIDEKGFVEGTEHRFIIVAKNIK